MKKHYETHVEDTDKLISVAGPILEYKSWYEQYRKLMEEQAQRKYGLYTPTSEGDDDDFPSIPGTIARYSALGLTNEEMSKNPVWVDKTGNGHDLQMKNFAWGGMSGVNGYVQNFNYFRNNATVDKVRIDEQSSNSIKVTLLTSGMGHVIYIPKDIYQFNKSYFIKISSEGYNEGYNEGDLFLSFYAPSTSTATTVKVPLNPNGITEIPAIKEDDFLAVYLFNAAGKVGSITIEQLPLYPGALVFDGVDDYGVCDNFPILTKEKGYTVVALRQWISIDGGPCGLVSNVKHWFEDGAFVLESLYPDSIYTTSFGATRGQKYLPHILTYQTSKSYNGNLIATGSYKGTDVLHVGRLVSTNVGARSNVAIWELVFLDHDATEEELTKIKDYFVKTYPWLFFDQAWTVTGKTNEDEDRATIANITGNGNDLVLSNFGFIEGSGYNEEGEYAGYLVTDGVDDKVVSAESIAFTDTWTIITDTVFLGKVSVASGILASNIFTVYNYQGSGTIAVTMGEGGSSLRVITSSIKAFSSDGTIYDAEWNEYHVEIGTIRALERLLKIGTSSNETSYFCQLAFKFLGIYNNQILSKDDCIKAYNYLQTLKAK
jgi:hypothetical protein